VGRRFQELAAVARSEEKHYERRAADAVGHALGRTLRRFATEPGGDDSLDYIDDLGEVYEMKLVTPQEYEALRGARGRWYPSGKLSMRWSFLILAPTMDDKFRPMPDFPDDDPTTIAGIEADGSFRVTRRAEREAEWQRQYAGGPLQIPRIGRREARILEEQLIVLEQGGITEARGAVPRTEGERTALAEIRRLTHGAVCMADSAPAGGGGIHIGVGWGSTRSGDPNVLAFRIQAWLDSPLGANLAHSLCQPRFKRRHGVLTFNSSEPEYWSAMESGVAFVPTTDLSLPPEIDTVWCLIGRVLLRFDPGLSWRAFETEPDISPAPRPAA
jgi:hypothetical protein